MATYPGRPRTSRPQPLAAIPPTPAGSPRPARVNISRLLALTTMLAGPLALIPAASSAAPTITIGEAQAQLAQLQQREDAAVEAFDAGRVAADAAQRRADEAAAQTTREAARLATLKQKASVFAAAAYTGGSGDPVTGLLTGGSADTATTLDRAANLDQIARSRTNQMVAVQAEETRLAAMRKEATDRAGEAAAQLRKLGAAKDAVGALLNQEQAVLNHVQADQRLQLDAQQAAAQRASRDAAGDPLNLPPGSGIAQTVISAAYSQRGKPYVYGAAGPDSYDCSGLVMWAFAKAGVSLPHSASGQYGYGTHIPPSDLQPGDIVFYSEGGTIGHDGIYIGNGQMIDANHTGGWVDVRPLYSGLIGGTRL